MSEDIKQLVSQLTLEEKAGLCSGDDFWYLKGVERLGIPSIMVADGPHGLRKQEDSADHLGIHESIPATCFPTAAGLGSTWNRNLIKKVGSALGEECQAEGVSILLGPGVNIKRSPLGGRNFEYFSEDPYLTGEIAAKHIEGVQSQGVGTSLKHFAVNNQEERRMTTDVIIDERTLREIYLTGFEKAIKQAEPWTVMSAYNKVNGVFASENPYLLSDILRDEWGFEGFVVSDWGAINEITASVKSGLELEMPPSGNVGVDQIIQAVKDGKLSETKLDTAVERILGVILKAASNRKENASYDKEQHHQLAREAAEESVVLLKNDDDILPLEKNGSIAVIGEFARKVRYQGSGSSHVNPNELENALDEMKKCVGESSKLQFAKGYQLDEESVDYNLLDEAVNIAAQSDVAVLFVGLPDSYESEGFDRKHMKIPESHTTLIDAVSKVNTNVVIVLSNGAPVEMPWIDQVKGVFEGYLGGQAFGSAITNLLFGYRNPSGKLAETFPRKLSDNPSFLNFPGKQNKVEYREGLYVGYRYYDKKELQPLYSFGHGLSYTQFKYSEMIIDKESMKDEETVEVRASIKNIGVVAGKEIAQLYVSDLTGEVDRPQKALKGFEKISLQPGEQKTIRFYLSKRDFAYFHEGHKDWVVSTGNYKIQIGESSSSILLEETIYITSTTILHNKVHRNTTIGEIYANPILSSAFQQVAQKFDLKRAASIDESSDQDEMAQSLLQNAPLRAVIGFTNGKVTEEMLAQLIDYLNQSLEKS